MPVAPSEKVALRQIEAMEKKAFARIERRARRTAEEERDGDTARGERILALVGGLGVPRARPRDFDAEIDKLESAAVAAAAAEVSTF